MDDESVYGPEFYKMAFSQAIEGGWLTDYKVIILTLKSDQVSESLGNLLAAEQDSGLNLDDAVKLLGCWDALADPEGVLSDRNVTGDQHNPLLRAITFTNTIKSSKMVEAHWQKVVDAARERTDVGAAGRPAAAGCSACGRNAELARSAAQAGLAEDKGRGERAGLPRAQQCTLSDRRRGRAGPGRRAVPGAAQVAGRRGAGGRPCHAAGGRQADGLHHPAGGNQPGSRNPTRPWTTTKLFRWCGACCAPCAATTTVLTLRSTRWTSTIPPPNASK